MTCTVHPLARASVTTRRRRRANSQFSSARAFVTASIVRLARDRRANDRREIERVGVVREPNDRWSSVALSRRRSRITPFAHSAVAASPPPCRAVGACVGRPFHTYMEIVIL